MKNVRVVHDLISRQLRIVLVQLVVSVCVSAASNDGSDYKNAEQSVLG
jgi:hypothetical protein